jgi:hypothetical protein
MRGDELTGTTARRRKFGGTAVVCMGTAVLLSIIGAEVGAAEATAAVAASADVHAVSLLTGPPRPCDPEETNQEGVAHDGKLGVCVPLGSERGLAEAQRLEELASDPLTGRAATPAALQKARAALGLETTGLLSAPVRRDPTGVADFIDGRGMSWNAYDLNSKLTPSQGAHPLRTSVLKISVHLLGDGNVILITENLSAEVTKELKATLDSARLGDRVLIWPGVRTPDRAGLP